MALLKTISLKTKLSAALIGGSLLLVAAYAAISLSVFGADKEASVFQSQRMVLETGRIAIDSKFRNAVLAARTVAATFDWAQAKPSAAGEKMFADEPSLIAMELWSERKNQSLFRLEKKSSVLPATDGVRTALPFSEIEIETLPSGETLMTTQFSDGERGAITLRAAFEMTMLLPSATSQLSLALVDANRVLAKADSHGLGMDLFLGTRESTKWDRAGNKFFVNRIPIGLGRLELVAVTREEDVTGPLETLFTRSVIFLGFVACALLFFSVNLSNAISERVSRATSVLKKIEGGDFGAASHVATEEETNEFGKTLAKLPAEISRRIAEANQRFQASERKMARDFARSLVKANKAIAAEGFEISRLADSRDGAHWATSFRHGNELFFATAEITGESRTVALTATASQAIFSVFERNPFSVSEMMDAWNAAIMRCAHERVFLNACILRVDLISGLGSSVSAGSRAIISLRAASTGKFSGEITSVDHGPALGKAPAGAWPENAFALSAGDALILPLGEAGAGGKIENVVRELSARAEYLPSAEALTKASLEAVQNDTGAFVEKIAFLSVKRVGAVRSLRLENESGFVQEVVLD